MESLYPNWQQAKNHGTASLPGIPILIDGLQSNFCPCCMNSIAKQPVPLCENSKSLEFLGYGFPLYFIFLKYSIILVLLLIVSYTSLGICWAAKANKQFCLNDAIRVIYNGQEIHCTSWMVFLARIESSLEFDESIIRITSFIIQLLALIYIRDILRKTNQYYDEREISPSDFSIFIENLPKMVGLAKTIRQLLADEILFQKEYEIEEIIYINELGRWFELKEQKKNLVNSLKQLMRNEEGTKSEGDEIVQKEEVKTKIDVLQKLIFQINTQIAQEQQKQRRLVETDQVICEKLIIIINRQENKEQIMQKFSQIDQVKLRKYFGRHAEKVKFSQAPQPKQIIWENINYPRSKFVKRIFLTWALFLLLLSIITVFFYYILGFKSNQIDNSQTFNQSPDQLAKRKITASLIVYICLFSIVFFNKFVLSTFLHKLTQYEMQKTAADFQFSFALKNVLGLFFTTAIMTLLVEDIKFNNIFSYDYGVVEEETIMFFMNGFFVPFVWLVNPWNILKKIQQKYYEGKTLLTQQQANKIMESTPYSIGKRYSQIIQVIWFTYLYASVIPIGSCFIFIGLCLFYWIDKYNLLRRSSVLENVSSQIGLKAMTLLDMTLILRPFGQLFFDSQIRGGINSGTIVCLSIGVIYMLLPINSILDLFHSQKFDMADDTYNQSKHTFHFNYSSMHPLNRENSIGKSQQFKNIEELEAKMRAYAFIQGKRKIHCETHQTDLDFDERNGGGISGVEFIHGLKNLPPLREEKRKKNMS